MSIGYIKFYRCITEHWIYPNHRKLTPFEVWVDLLMMANYEDKKAVMDGKPVDVKRGQILRSQKNLALRWMWGDKEARNFLKTLQKDKMILLQPCKKWTLVTICNYDTYQDSGNTEATQRKRKGKPEEIQRPTSKEDKEIKEDIDVKIELYIDKFNAIRKSKFKGVDKPFMQNFKKLLESDYTANDSLVALKNAMQDKFHIDNNFKYLTPEFITRLDKIELFLNSGKPTETKEQEIERREREWLNR